MNNENDQINHPEDTSQDDRLKPTPTDTSPRNLLTTEPVPSPDVSPEPSPDSHPLKNPGQLLDFSVSEIRGALETLASDRTEEELADHVVATYGPRIGVSMDDPPAQLIRSILEETRGQPDIRVARLHDFFLPYWKSDTVALRWEELDRRYFEEQGEFTPIRDPLSYHLSPSRSELYLHLGPSHTLTKRDRRDGTAIFPTMLLEAIQELALQLRNNPRLASVRTVEAISWVVRRFPEWFTFLGFTIDKEPVSEDFREKHFTSEQPGSVYRAHISKETFLSRFPANPSPE